MESPEQSQANFFSEMQVPEGTHPPTGNESFTPSRSDCEEVRRVREALIEEYNGPNPEELADKAEYIRACESLVKIEMRKNGYKAPLKNRGFLSVVIMTTQTASKMTYPLNKDDFFANADGSGQVSGLTGINNYVEKWMLPKKFPREGGRNNNGSMGLCRTWVGLLNKLYSEFGRVAHGWILNHWIEEAATFFTEEPVTVKCNAKCHVQDFLHNTVAKFKAKEKEWSGVRLVGSMMQHMVGAKLSITLGEHRVEHHPINQSDMQTGRDGDFTIGDCVFHVTSAPTEALIKRCRDNYYDNLRPIIITLSENVGAAVTLARNIDLDKEIEVLAFEPCIASGMLNVSLLKDVKPVEAVREFVGVYNDIVETHEGSSVTTIKLV